MKLQRLIPALLMFCCLCMPTMAAAPHWDAVLLTDLGLYHFDPHTVRQKDGIHSIQTLLDYKTTQETSEGKKYRSSKTEIQLNCKSHSARIMHTTYYAAPMGSGQEVHKEGSVREWLEVVKGTPIERIAHRIC